MDANMKRLMKRAVDTVHVEWKGAETKLGSRLYQALLAESVLRIAAQQDESVSADKVREIVIQGWFHIDDLIEEML